MDDRWDRVILVAGFCSDGEGFIYDFERLLQDFCLSLACLRGKKKKKKRRRVEAVREERQRLVVEY